MSRPPLEVADIIRAVGKRFIDKNRSWLTGLHLKVLTAIERCRTAGLGGHRDRCTRCGYQSAISYNSCRNRHCPKCQTGARNKWLAARSQELLPVPYVHVVFTLPQELVPLAYHNKRLLYGLLFQASAATLLEVAADPKHLGAEIGVLSVLHTWGQTLQQHPHVHCVIPTGGLSPDRTRWVKPRYSFFLPVKVLGRVFRGKFVDGLKRAWQRHELCLPGSLKSFSKEAAFHAFVRSLFRKDWVVYAKPPFGGPQYVLHYLARYTHRVAISNHRLVSFADDQVTFRWKNYRRDGRQALMTLSADEFLRRFLQHTLPRGFVRIRAFGFLANRRRAELLPVCREALAAATPVPEADSQIATPLWRCPHCGGTMMVAERFTRQELIWESNRQGVAIDSS